MALKHLVEYTVMIGLMTIFCPSLTSVYQAYLGCTPVAIFIGKSTDLDKLYYIQI